MLALFPVLKREVTSRTFNVGEQLLADRLANLGVLSVGSNGDGGDGRHFGVEDGMDICIRASLLEAVAGAVKEGGAASKSWGPDSLSWVGRCGQVGQRGKVLEGEVVDELRQSWK